LSAGLKKHLLDTPLDVAEMIRGFVARCAIVPVQSLDTGQMYPRAKLPVRGSMEDYDDVTELVVDLFEPALPTSLLS
jgi:hypothetical protein